MGYDRKEYEGKHPMEIGQTDRYNASKHLYDRMMGGEKFSIERTATTGERYIVHLVPLKNEKGSKPAWYTWILRILNKQKKKVQNLLR